MSNLETNGKNIGRLTIDAKSVFSNIQLSQKEQQKLNMDLKQVCRELRADAERYKEDNEKQLNEMNSLKARITSLNETKLNAEGDRDKLKTLLKTTKRKLHAKEQELRCREAEIETVRAEKDQNLKMYRSMEIDQRSMKVNVEDLRRQINQHIQMNEKLRSENEDLLVVQADAERYKKENQDKDQELKRLSQQLTSLTTTRLNAEEARDQANVLLKASEKKFRSKEKELRRRESEIESLKLNLLEECAKKDVQLMEYNQKLKIYISSEIDQRSMKATVEDLQRKINSHIKMNEKLRSANENLLVREADAERYKKDNQEKDQELKRLYRRLNEMESYKAQIASLSKTKLNAEDARDQANVLLKASEKKLRAKEQVLRRRVSEIESVKLNLLEERAKRDVELREKDQNMKATVEDLQKKINRHIHMNEKLRAENEELLVREADAERYKKDNQEKDQELKRLYRRLTEMKGLKAQITSLNTTKLNAEEASDQANVLLKASEKKLRWKEKDLLTKEAEIEALKLKLSDERAKKSALLREKVKKLKIFRQMEIDQRSMKATVDDLQKEINRLIEMNGKLRSANQDLLVREADAECYKKDNLEKDQELKRLYRRLNEMEGFKAQITSLTTTKLNAEEARDQANGLLKASEKKLRAKEKEIRRKEAEIESIKLMLDEYAKRDVQLAKKDEQLQTYRDIKIEELGLKATTEDLQKELYHQIKMNGRLHSDYENLRVGTKIKINSQNRILSSIQKNYFSNHSENIKKIRDLVDIASHDNSIENSVGSSAKCIRGAQDYMIQNTVDSSARSTSGPHDLSARSISGTQDYSIENTVGSSARRISGPHDYSIENTVGSSARSISGPNDFSIGSTVDSSARSISGSVAGNSVPDPRPSSSLLRESMKYALKKKKREFEGRRYITHPKRRRTLG